VKLAVTGAPAAMGYCHCTSCRQWSASPINGFTLWAPDAVRVEQGADNLASYKKTERSVRTWCKTCGGHVFTEHPHWKLIDVFSATIPEFPFKPGVHVNSQETVLHIHDVLPKLKDLPSEMGGTGQAIPE
jgi:hypothetical protein